MAPRRFYTVQVSLHNVLWMPPFLRRDGLDMPHTGSEMCRLLPRSPATMSSSTLAELTKQSNSARKKITACVLHNPPIYLLINGKAVNSKSMLLCLKLTFLRTSYSVSSHQTTHQPNSTRSKSTGNITNYEQETRRSMPAVQQNYHSLRISNRIPLRD